MPGFHRFLPATCRPHSRCTVPVLVSNSAGSHVVGSGFWPIEVHPVGRGTIRPLEQLHRPAFCKIVAERHRSQTPASQGRPRQLALAIPDQIRRGV